MCTSYRCLNLLMVQEVIKFLPEVGLWLTGADGIYSTGRLNTTVEVPLRPRATEREQRRWSGANSLSLYPLSNSHSPAKATGILRRIHPWSPRREQGGAFFSQRQSWVTATASWQHRLPLFGWFQKKSADFRPREASHSGCEHMHKNKWDSERLKLWF